MTDATAPIIDIQGVVFWDEIFNPQSNQPELRPVRTEIRFQRMGYDEWEVVRYQNVVPDHLNKFTHPQHETPPAEEEATD